LFKKNTGLRPKLGNTYYHITINTILWCIWVKGHTQIKTTFFMFCLTANTGYVYAYGMAYYYGPIIIFQSRPGVDPDFLKRGDKQGNPNPTSQFHRKYYFGQKEEDRRRKK
jgi:hypothetical protein